MLDSEPLRARLRATLEKAAEAIAAGYPNVAWHVEDVKSRHYSVSLLLVFVDQRSPEDELVVVSGKLHRGPTPAWSIDCTYGDGTFIDEDAVSESDSAQMLADSDLAAARLATFLARCRRPMIKLLS